MFEKGHFGTCHRCQLTGKHIQAIKHVPLYLNTVAEHPFEYLIIGPMPWSKAGSNFLLTVMCQAMRYPAAHPLKNITTSSYTVQESQRLSSQTRDLTSPPTCCRSFKTYTVPGSGMLISSVAVATSVVRSPPSFDQAAVFEGELYIPDYAMLRGHLKNSESLAKLDVMLKHLPDPKQTPLLTPL